jgi:hypothetical protein
MQNTQAGSRRREELRSAFRQTFSNAIGKIHRKYELALGSSIAFRLNASKVEDCLVFVP